MVQHRSYQSPDAGSIPAGPTLNIWQSIIANFIGGFLALLLIMVFKLFLTGQIL